MSSQSDSVDDGLKRITEFMEALNIQRFKENEPDSWSASYT